MPPDITLKKDTLRPVRPQRADRLSDLSRLSPDLNLIPFRPQSCRGSVDLASSLTKSSCVFPRIQPGEELEYAEGLPSPSATVIP